MTTTIVPSITSTNYETGVSTTPSRVASEHPGPLNYIVGFFLVGLAWGFTTPFIRRAARTHTATFHPVLESSWVRASRVLSALLGALFAVVDLLRNPRYAVPLLLNLTGSVWFFLLIGQAGEFFLVFVSGILFLFFAFFCIS